MRLGVVFSLLFLMVGLVFHQFYYEKLDFQILTNKSNSIDDKTKLRPNVNENANRIIATESANQISNQAVIEQNLPKQIINSKLEKPLESDMFNSSFENILGEKNKSILARAKIENDFLGKYKKEKFDFYLNDTSESWSFFTDVNVSLEATEEAIFQMGPYKITSSKLNTIQNAKLIYNENQKVFAIFTGRVVATLESSFDSEEISKDYSFRLNSVNSDIKTAFFTLPPTSGLDQLRIQLAQDPRIKNFYFEVINNQWQKN